MSTKIYNAFRFDGSIDELMQHCRKYRTRWHQHQVMKLRSLDEVANGISFTSAHAKIKEQSTKMFPDWSDDFDIRGSVVIYPYDTIVIQTFFNDRTAPTFTDDRFSDFHYQNQCDPWFQFENLGKRKLKAAEKDWKARKRFWDMVFSDGLDSPSEAGFSYEFVSFYDMNNIAMAICNSQERKLAPKELA